MLIDTTMFILEQKKRNIKIKREGDRLIKEKLGLKRKKYSQKEEEKPEKEKRSEKKVKQGNNIRLGKKRSFDSSLKLSQVL